MSFPSKLPLLIYRLVLSPLLHLLGGAGFGCRYEPSCSQFAEEALRIHGVFRGSRLAIWRVLRCNPFSGSGFDPVPSANVQMSFNEDNRVISRSHDSQR